MEKVLKRNTIKDIAKIAGVSPAAVSFVINDREGVSEATREKIKSIIKATGFQPNTSSRRLSSQKSFNIALVYPITASPFSDFFYNEIVKGLIDRFSKEDYNVVLSRLRMKDDKHLLPNIIKRRDADGTIFLQDIDPVILSRMDETGIPYVLVDVHTLDYTHRHVSVDSEQSIYTAVNYLISQGHTKIGLLGTDWLHSYYMQCFTGYQRALEEHRLTMHPTWLQKNAKSKESIEKCMDNILSASIRPTAICCMGDIYAIQAMHYAKAQGLDIPEDLSFISIDDIILSRYVEPALTTIGYDKQQMGEIAAELLLNKIKGNETQSVIVKSDTIIERMSVKQI